MFSLLRRQADFKTFKMFALKRNVATHVGKAVHVDRPQNRRNAHHYNGNEKGNPRNVIVDNGPKFWENDSNWDGEDAFDPHAEDNFVEYRQQGYLGEEEQSYQDYTEYDNEWEGLEGKNHSRSTKVHPRLESRLFAGFHLWTKDSMSNNWTEEWLPLVTHVQKGFFLHRKRWKGTISCPNGDSITGEWLDAQLLGTSVVKLKGKSTYEGEYDPVEQRFVGKIILKDGTIQEGIWLRGRPEGTMTVSSFGQEFTGSTAGDDDV